MMQADATTRWAARALFLLMAISSVVFIEPAPFDLLVLPVFVLLLLAGFRVPNESGLFLVFVLLFLLGNLISFSDVDIFTDAVKYMAITMYMFVIWLCFVCLFYRDPDAMFRAFWAGYVAASVVCVLLGVLGFFDLMPSSERFLLYGRIKGTFKDPNVLGPYLIAPILFLASRYFTLRGFGRFGALLLAGLLFLGLLMSFSRGAWGNFVLSAMIYLALALRHRKTTLRQFVRYMSWGGMVVAFGMAMLVAALQIPKVQQLMEERAALVQGYDVQEGGRFDTQEKTLKASFEKPLGLGPGEGNYDFNIVPHDVFLLVLSENGWIGLAGFAGFILLHVLGFLVFLRQSRLAGETLDSGFLIVVSVSLATFLQSFLIDSIHWRHLFFLLGAADGYIFWRQGMRARALAPAYPRSTRFTAARA